MSSHSNESALLSEKCAPQKQKRRRNILLWPFYSPLFFAHKTPMSLGFPDVLCYQKTVTYFLISNRNTGLHSHFRCHIAIEVHIYIQYNTIYNTIQKPKPETQAGNGAYTRKGKQGKERALFHFGDGESPLKFKVQCGTPVCSCHCIVQHSTYCATTRLLHAQRSRIYWELALAGACELINSPS